MKKKRFNHTIIAKLLLGMYKITKIDLFENLWLDMAEKYYYG